MGHITPLKAVKIILVISFTIFVLFNLHYIHLSTSGVGRVRILRDTSTASGSQLSSNAKVNAVNHRSVKDKQPISKDTELKPNPIFPINPSEEDTVVEKDDLTLTRLLNESLRFIIEDINQRQDIHNMDKFPPKQNGTYAHIIVVQIHNRDSYLKALIESLRTVSGINSSLLIASHDYYSKEVFDAVTSIEFMPVREV